MTLSDCINYFAQLLNACFGAYRLEIWGVPIWVYCAAIIVFAVTVAFLRFVIMPFLTGNGGEK